MTTKTRIALIALGDHALHSHFAPLLKMDDVELAGVFDPKDDGFERAATKYGNTPNRYNTYEDVLADKDVDAVLICSPDKFHLPQLEAAVNAGKHVFCEKPMINSQDELPRLKAALEKARNENIVVTSCHPRRFDPPYVWLKENIDELTEKYGKALELSLDFTYHKPSKQGLHGGSMLQDHFNHEIDYLHFVFGHSDLEAHKLLDEEDRYHAAGVREDGLVFNFRGSRRLDVRTYSESMHVRFDRADVHIDTYNTNRSYIYDHHTSPHMLEEVGGSLEEKAGHEPIVGLPIRDYDVHFHLINRNFIDAINGKAKNYLDDKDMIVNSALSVAFAKQKSLSYKF